MMTPDLRKRLENLSVGTVILDRRYYRDRAEVDVYLKLYEMGFCTLVETGPGDSVLKFTINDDGRQALSTG